MESDLWEYLKSTDKPIVFYGMGNGADKIYNVLKSLGKEPSAVFATDGFVRKKQVYGLTLSSLSEVENKFDDMIVLLCFGSSREEVIENVKRISSRHELYAPDVPVYGDTLFTKDFYLKNKSRFDFVYERLEDGVSKKTFCDIINAKISGKTEYLFDCETDKDEPYRTFLKLNDSEIFVDLGAYRGDTVSEFLSRVSDYKAIYAAEPDTKTFLKLENALKGLKNVNLINACISDKCGKEPFCMNASRGSSNKENATLCDSVTLDSITDRATFIKMDVEGAEAKAISGAKNLIYNCKPKMLISCYHKSEDLFLLPEKVLSIRNDYKIYMRHQRSLPAWDTCFYFI